MSITVKLQSIVALRRFVAGFIAFIADNPSFLRFGLASLTNSFWLLTLFRIMTHAIAVVAAEAAFIVSVGIDSIHVWFTLAVVGVDTLCKQTIVDTSCQQTIVDSLCQVVVYSRCIQGRDR